MIADPATHSPAAPATVPAPYGSSHEHLADLLRRHDMLLKRYLAHGQAQRTAGVPGFATVSERDVRQLLDGPALRDEAAAEARAAQRGLLQWQQHIDARVEQSRLHGVRLSLHELARRFALRPREVDLLLACLAVELDVRYERVHGFLHDDMTRRLASPAIAIGLAAGTPQDQAACRALLGPAAPLRHYRVLELLDEGTALPWLSRPLRVDERIVSFLLEDPAPDARIASHLLALDVSGELGETAADLARWADAARAAGARPLIHLHGADLAGADGVAAGVARALDLPLMTVDVDALLDAGADVEQGLFLLFREGLLGQAALYFRGIQRLFEPPQAAARLRAWLNGLAQMGCIALAAGEAPWSWPLPAAPVLLQTVALRPDSALDQLQAWQALAGPSWDEADLHRLVSLHPLPVPAIHAVWRMACGLAAGQHPAGGTAPVPDIDQVRQACRAHAGTPTSALARPVEPRHGWRDLVLPAPQLEQLAALCSQARHASRVYGDWCFERKLSLGRGLNALFSGPPGTGKSLAAEVVAAELGLALLKIDLSQIVSKYIGETEKNLRQLFDQAARANAILFFDEADALLGKRTEVKDAHDRHANTETAYMLQKMEEYPGITVLATNLRQNMDAAFARRMRFIVDFPFPEEADRLRIWQSVWPAEVPLGADVDAAALARQFRLSGGGIRNVALSAAFLAAEQGQPVAMADLHRAARRELQKMGRLVTEDEPRRAA